MAADPLSWADGSPRTLRHVLSDVWRDASLLMRQHAELAADEASQRAAGIGTDLALSVAAVALLHGGVLAILASLALALHAAGIAAWLAVLLVALLAIVCGGGFALWAKRRLAARVSPESETLMALGETSDWIADALRGNER